MEAGVDLDFHSVYRQLAGVDYYDSGLQGRCNREGKQAAEDSNVYIFSLAEREYMPGQMKTNGCSKLAYESGGLEFLGPRNC